MTGVLTGAASSCPSKRSALPPPFCVSPFRTARHPRLSGVSRPCSPSWLVGAAHPNLVLTPAGSMLNPAVVGPLAARVRVPPQQRVFAPSGRTTLGRDGCPAGGAGSFRGLHARDDQTWRYCCGHTDWLLEAGMDRDSAGPCAASHISSRLALRRSTSTRESHSSSLTPCAVTVRP